MSKGRILKLLDILQQQTDPEHPLTSEQLITLLDQQGETVERKTIYDDVKILNENGYETGLYRNSQANGYYYDAHIFSLPELRILCDAILASNFIDEKKSDDLVERLLKLTSVHEREVITATERQPHHKKVNKQILYNIDRLQRAIRERRGISFRYYDVTIDGQKRYRPRKYRAIPYAIVMNEGRYYMISWFARMNDFITYRIDRMENIEDYEHEEAYQPLDLEQYVASRFSMFAGEQTAITLRCDNILAEEMRDKFGDELIIVEKGDDHFVINVRAQVSEMFFGWLYGFGDKARILAPESVIAEYKAGMRRMLEEYGG